MGLHCFSIRGLSHDKSRGVKDRLGIYTDMSFRFPRVLNKNLERSLPIGLLPRSAVLIRSLMTRACDAALPPDVRKGSAFPQAASRFVQAPPWNWGVAPNESR